MMIRISPVVYCMLLMVPLAMAQAPEPVDVLRDRPDSPSEKHESGLLGDVFESRSAGIAFRAPAGCKETRRPIGDELVQYSDESRKWNLRVSQVQLPEPLPLTKFRDAKGVEQPGMLELTLNQLKMDLAGGEVLRDDVLAAGDVAMGLLALRYSHGNQTLLHQQALVRSSDRHWFVFTFTSPAPRGDDLSDDPRVREAVETFNAVLDSVRLLDQTSLREEQTQRLFRTRALFMNITETRLRNTLIGEQWMRILRDGKDIGYTYIVEETAPDLPRRQSASRKVSNGEGVLIGVRSRTLPEPGVQIDSESWMWMSFDRRHEKWSSIATIASGGKRELVSEFGASDHEQKRVLVEQARPGEFRSDGSADLNQPPIRAQDVYTLNVTHFTRTSTAQPVVRELPVFYLPQALAQLLPRLLPRFEIKGYMFAGYVSDEREVIARYIDVGREEEVLLGSDRVRAIPIRDRFGLEGSVTTHYVSHDGKYLGSINTDTKMTVLPTDASTLAQIWKDADLTRPAAVEQDK